MIGDNPSLFKGDELPVERVSWEDCQRFIGKLAGLTPGLCPALPTEAQWEYACRAGTRTVFSFGDGLDTERANYHGNYPYNDGARGAYRQVTPPVYSFPPNPWGLYHMHGNLWEWCADWYGAYSGGAVVDPVGPAEGQYRVLRGGSWSSGGHLLRSAYRNRDPPDFRLELIGLRLAGGFDPQAGAAGAGAMTADGREGQP